MMPTHLSYSQYSSYTRCPRSWYLGRLRGGQEVQSWYTPIGTAVHQMIESYIEDPSRDLHPAEFFYPLVEKQMLVEPDLGKWLAGGPQADPTVGDKALQKVSDCFERAVEMLQDVDVWEVEYDASSSLPGLEVPLKAFVDIVGEHKKKGPVILDWKTGSTKPDNFQLETYAALLKQSGFPTATAVGDERLNGRYAMLAPGSSNTRFVDLSSVSPLEVGKKYQEVYDQMKRKIYRADSGFSCDWCFQQLNCKVKSGLDARTEYYDHSEEDGYPF